MVHNIPACHKRIAKGTSSFHFHIKIHQRQPRPRNKTYKWNFTRNWKILQVNCICNYAPIWEIQSCQSQKQERSYFSYTYNDHYISGWCCRVINFDCRWEMESRAKSKELSFILLMAMISPPPLTSSSQVKVKFWNLGSRTYGNYLKIKAELIALYLHLIWYD